MIRPDYTGMTRAQKREARRAWADSLIESLRNRPAHVIERTLTQRVEVPVYVETPKPETNDQRIIETYAEPGETPEQTRTRLNDVWFYLNQRFIALSRGEKWPEPLTDSEHTLMNELSIFARG